MEEIEIIVEKFKSLLYKNGKYHYHNWFSVANQLYRVEFESKPLGEMVDFHEKLWAIQNNCFVKPKCYCGKTCSLISPKLGFRIYCSRQCCNSSPVFKQNKTDSNMLKYGVKNVFQNKETKDKSQITKLERYGDKFYRNEDKVSNTVQDRYGVDFVSQVEEFKVKQQIATLERYRTNVLPGRLQQLTELKIFPVDWTIDDYIGGCKNPIYKFVHRECNKEYFGSFRDGTIPTCPYCRGGRSQIEQKLYNALEVLFPDEIEMSNRKLIAPKEIDIIVRDIGIEVNGAYWHQADIEKTSLLAKSDLCPIELLHFWDIELSKKFDICLSMICARLDTFTIFPEVQEIRRLSVLEAKDFFDINHLSGYIPSTYTIGSISEGVIQAAISVNRNTITQFCSKIFTKTDVNELFNQIRIDFITKKLKVQIDNRFGLDIELLSLGFVQDKEIKPKFWLATSSEIIPFSKVNLETGKYLKIRDCGHKVFVIDL